MTVEDEIKAAYGHDAEGREHEAVKHYDNAHRLGVPEHLRRRFLVGYGSTLRNVGRAEEAIVLLAEAHDADPDYPAFTAFLALALISAGHPNAALATMIGCALDAVPKQEWDGYDRALGEYQKELLES
jgi:tetratricopeptide (TPR) repeat protein